MRLSLVAGLVGGLLLCSSANAGQCDGKITRVYIGVYDDLLVGISPGPGTFIGICNLSTDYPLVSAQKCQRYYAAVLTALATGQRIVFSYSDTLPACTSLPVNSNVLANQLFIGG